MQALLKDRGVESSHVSISKRLNLWLGPSINKINKAAEVQLGTLEQIATEALSKYAALCAKQEADMSIGERNYFRTVGEWFDRIARLRGLYGPQTQVAVQVNINAKKELWKILGYES